MFRNNPTCAHIAMSAMASHSMSAIAPHIALSAMAAHIAMPAMADPIAVLFPGI